jgi:MFS family permease
MRAREEGDGQVEAKAEAESQGSARDALRYPVFRRVFFGAFLSNIGTWMQNVVLGALAYDLTESSTFVGIMVFAQLGPMLLLSAVGGVLADHVDRRRLLIGVAFFQVVTALVLAGVVVPDEPNKALMVVVVGILGAGQALYAPTYTSLLPQLVERRDLAGAVSLNSASMNLSRVVGPVIGAFLDSLVGAPAVFAVNGLSYLFVVWALRSVTLPPPANGGVANSRGWRALSDGFRIVRGHRVLGPSLVTIFTLSLISLPFIGQFPVVAERNLGVDERSTTYGVLYAAFGIGAVLGALSIGTVFKHLSRVRMVRGGLGGFAVALAVLALVRGPLPAFPALTVLGFCYIAAVTSLMTLVQEHCEEHTRGRVMALWVMGWGGTVPLGNLLAGPLIEWTSITAVMLVGAAWAVALAVYLRQAAHQPASSPADQSDQSEQPEPEPEPLVLVTPPATCPGR